MKALPDPVVRPCAERWLLCGALLLTLAGGACAQAPNITPSHLAPATAGVSYQAIITADETVTWYAADTGANCTSMTADSPIPGLTFSTIDSTHAELSGVPAKAGTYAYAVTGSHFVGNISEFSSYCTTQPYSLLVNPAPAGGSSLNITTTSLAPGGTGQNYMQTISAAGGAPPYSFSASGLPMGLNISAGGSITGVPAMGGNFSVTVTVTDSMNSQASHTYTLSIDTSLTITTPSLPAASVGESYYQQVSAVAGTPPYTFSGTGFPFSLPITSSGVISGTPAAADAGVYMVEVDVVDAAKHSASAQYTLTIFGLPSFSTPSPLPTGMVGTTYSQTVAATGGLGPYSFFLLPTANPLPPGLTLATSGVLSGTPSAAGSFTFTLQVVDANKNSGTKSFTVLINAGSQPLTVSPSSVQFVSTSGGDIPGPQTLMISGSGTPVSFSVAVDDGNGGPAPAWLAATPRASMTPAVVRVSIVPNTLAVGTYTARVRGTIPGSSAPLFSATVSYTVSTSAPVVTVAPSLLRYRATITNPQTLQQTFVLRNPGGGGPVPITLSVVNKSPWITMVTPSAQSIQQNSPVLVKVIVNTQGLPVGALRDAVRVTTPLPSPYNQIDVPVSLFVAQSGPALSLSDNGVRIPSTQGNATSRVEQIFVRDTGDSGTAVNWTAQVARGAGLITLTNSTGVSTPGNPSSFSFRAGSDASSTPGGNSALIEVSDPKSQSSPQFVVVVVDVAASGTPPDPDPTPAGLEFVAVSGGTAPAAQQITVNTNSASPVAFSVGVSTDDGGNWLSATANASTTSQASPAQISVSVNPGASTSAVSTGAVNISIGAIVRSVNIILIVKPAGTVAGFESARAAGTCAPASVAFVETGLVNSFSVPAGYPAYLAVQVADNCGNALSNASVVASFSNGDPPISLSGDQQSGAYTGTWQPGIAAAEMTVTLDATSGSLNPAEMQLSGNVNANSNLPPSLAIGGFVNNLSFQKGAPLAPGTVTAVFGDNLAPAPASPTKVPLPAAFNGIEALVGGLDSPFFYVSKTQLVVEVPAELSANQTYSALLVANGQYTVPQDIDFAPVTPATVTYSDGITLVAQHAGTTVLVDSTHPAKPGETLTIYLVGMGATTPAVTSGTPAPSSPLASVPPNVQVTVAGQQASISFAGLTPGGVGLYQINFQVPSSATTGSLDVAITQNRVAANATKLVVAQ